MNLLILAVILAESGGNPRAQSPARAVGLMQLTPIAVEEVQQQAGITGQTPDLFNPKVNVYYGTAYLQYCQNRTRNVSEALACYNGGMRQVHRARRGWRMARETRNYVARVLAYRDLYRLLEKKYGYSYEIVD